MVNNSEEIQRICRTCFKKIPNESLYYELDESEPNTNPSLQQKLNTCVPELNLIITPNAIVCKYCFRAINSSYEFNILCRQSELKIQKYIQLHSNNVATIDLTEIAEAIQINSTYITDVHIKHENVDVEDDIFERSINTQCTSTTYLPSAIDNSPTDNKSSKKEATLKQFHGKGSAIKINVIYKCHMCTFVTKYKPQFVTHVRNHCTKHDYRHTGRKNDFPPLYKKHGKVDNVYKTNKNTITSSNKQNFITQKDCTTNVAYQPAVTDLNTATGIQLRKSRSRAKAPYNKSKTTNISQRNVPPALKEKPFLCTFCDFRSNYKKNLKTHMKFHTGEKPFTCDICNYSCFQKGNLKKHMAIHSTQEPFRCNQCDFMAKRKDSLHRHMQSHTGEKRFVCNICNYSCLQKSNLKIHMAIHSTPEPFRCNQCDFKTCYKNNLQRHVKIHTGETPFTCNVCDCKFMQERYLKQHMETHLTEKRFKCNRCEFTTKHKSYLQKHSTIHDSKSKKRVKIHRK